LPSTTNDSIFTIGELLGTITTLWPTQGPGSLSYPPKTLIFSLCAFLFAFVYSSKGARPIPRLLTKDAQKVSNVINNIINSDSGFICDFWNWETTYYLPFSTGLSQNKIVIIDSNNQIEHIKEQVANMISENHSGVILVNKNNSLYKILIRQGNNYRCEINNVTLALEHIFENDSIICFKYQSKIL